MSILQNTIIYKNGKPVKTDEIPPDKGRAIEKNRNTINLITRFSTPKRAYRSTYSLDYSDQKKALVLNTFRYEVFDWDTQRYQSAQLQSIRHEFYYFTDDSNYQVDVTIDNQVNYSPVCRIDNMQTAKQSWIRDDLVYYCKKNKASKQKQPLLQFKKTCPSDLIGHPDAAWKLPILRYYCLGELHTTTRQLKDIHFPIEIPTIDPPQPGFNLTDIYPKTFRPYLDPYVKIKPPADIDQR